MAIFEFDFMRRAFLVGILLAVIIPCIGLVVVLKRLSMMGDALSHSSLAGVAAGLLLGINPILGATFASIAAAITIEHVRKRIPKYSELSVAVVMSAGIGLAGVLSGFVANTTSFNSFLFGSIVAISDFELMVVAGVSLAVIVTVRLLYKELFYISFDEHSARLAGVPVSLVNFIFIILTAVTVSVAARTVGALVVSSLMVIPVTCSLQLEKSFRKTAIFSICFAVAFTICGLFLSFYLDLKPGATIVLVGVLSLLIIIMAKTIVAKFKKAV